MVLCSVPGLTIYSCRGELSNVLAKGYTALDTLGAVCCELLYVICGVVTSLFTSVCVQRIKAGIMSNRNENGANVVAGAAKPSPAGAIIPSP